MAARFDGRDLLSRWKGKKILFVGDSISLNQWESLVCMLHAAAQASRTSYSRGNPVSTVTFQVRAVPAYSSSDSVSATSHPSLPLHQHRYRRKYCSSAQHSG